MLRFLREGNKRTKTIWWFLTILTVGSSPGPQWAREMSKPEHEE